MTRDNFLNLARSAARRATEQVGSNEGQIGNLVLTQTGAKGEPTVREPELRTAFQQEADSRGRLYGIEVPTFCTYRFSGTGYRRALTDFAVLDSTAPNRLRGVLVEFKAGQPQGEHGGEVASVEIAQEDGEEGVLGSGVGDGDGNTNYPAIRKDLHKLLAEPVLYGRCMFHVCHAEDVGTVPTLVAKYDAAMIRALRDAEETRLRVSDVVREGSAEGGGAWFALLILAVRQRGKERAGEGSRLHIGDWQGQRWQVTPDPHFP